MWAFAFRALMFLLKVFVFVLFYLYVDWRIRLFAGLVSCGWIMLCLLCSQKHIVQILATAGSGRMETFGVPEARLFGLFLNGWRKWALMVVMPTAEEETFVCCVCPELQVCRLSKFFSLDVLLNGVRHRNFIKTITGWKSLCRSFSLFFC